MRAFIIIFFILFLVCAGGAYYFWEQHENEIAELRQALQGSRNISDNSSVVETANKVKSINVALLILQDELDKQDNRIRVLENKEKGTSEPISILGIKVKPPEVRDAGDYSMEVKVANNKNTEANTFLILTLIAKEQTAKVNEGRTRVVLPISSPKFTVAGGHTVLMQFSTVNPIFIGANTSRVVSLSLHLDYDSGITDWDYSIDWSGY